MKRIIYIASLALLPFLPSPAPAATEPLYTKDAAGNFVPVMLDTNSAVPTLSGPLMDLFTSMTTWSNIAVAPYGIYDTGTKKAGMGLLALYNATDYVAGGIGLQYLNGSVWMPNAQFQLQAPLTIAGKVTLMPFGFTGIGTPISGGHTTGVPDNGSPVGILGAGMALKLYGDVKASHLDAFFACAKWTGFQGEQWYLGIAYRF